MHVCGGARERGGRRSRERERGGGAGGEKRERYLYTSDPPLAVDHGPSGHHIAK